MYVWTNYILDESHRFESLSAVSLCFTSASNGSFVSLHTNTGGDIPYISV